MPWFLLLSSNLLIIAYSSGFKYQKTTLQSFLMKRKFIGRRPGYFREFEQLYFVKGTAVTVTNTFFCVFKIPAFAERERDLFTLGHLSSHGPVTKGDQRGTTQGVTAWLLRTHTFCFLPEGARMAATGPHWQKLSTSTNVLILLFGSFNFNVFKLKLLLKYNGHSILWISGVQHSYSTFVYLQGYHHSKSSNHLSPHTVTTVVLAKFSMLYITSRWPIYFTTGSSYLLFPFIFFHPTLTPIDLFSVSYESVPVSFIFTHKFSFFSVWTPGRNFVLWTMLFIKKLVMLTFRWNGLQYQVIPFLRILPWLCISPRGKPAESLKWPTRLNTAWSYYHFYLFASCPSRSLHLSPAGLACPECQTLYLIWVCSEFTLLPGFCRAF